MVFLQTAMDYYGLVLMKLRPITKIEDTEMASPKHDVKLSNSVIKNDRLRRIFVNSNAWLRGTWRFGSTAASRLTISKHRKARNAT